MINLLDIHVSFTGHKALDGVSLHVKEGMLLGIVGPGGSGKSTLCRVVAGLLRPDSGIVMVDGLDFVLADKKKLQTKQKQIGVQFQNDALFEHMTVIENISYPLMRTSDLSKNQIAEVALEHLSMVGLLEFADVFPSSMSGGQRRRVALARACVSEPKILICDDPTAGLDPVTSRQILDMIAGIRYQNKSTVIIVSSDVVGLMSVASSMALIWKGKIIEEDTASAFLKSEKTQVKRFLEDAKLPFKGWSWE